MKNKYIDLIDQTYYFPQDEFTLDGDELRFHNIDLMELVRKYGAPLKFMYLPRIFSAPKAGLKRLSRSTSTKERTTIVIALKVRISNT